MSRKTHEPGVQGKGERGTSLVEVLVSLLIFLFLMIGVLQMFALAFVVNKGSEARTEMTYKCQQVLENMRYLNGIYKKSGTTALPLDLQTGWFPLTNGATHDLSTFTQTQLSTSFWGPSQTNVVEMIKPRYALTMSVRDGDLGSPGVAPGYWVLTITARPNSASDANRYVGKQPARRIVEYVSQLPK